MSHRAGYYRLNGPYIRAREARLLLPGVGAGLAAQPLPRRWPAVHRLDDTEIGKTLLMTIAILAAVLGLLIASAAITIPRLVGRRNQPEDHADSQAYLKETGRSAEDIAQGNAGGSAGHSPH